jgi:hypothetical protein
MEPTDLSLLCLHQSSGTGFQLDSRTGPKQLYELSYNYHCYFRNRNCFFLYSFSTDHERNTASISFFFFFSLRGHCSDLAETHLQTVLYSYFRMLPNDGLATFVYLRCCCLAIAVAQLFVSLSFRSNGLVCHIIQDV